MAGFEANFSSPVTSASAAFPYLAALSDDEAADRFFLEDLKLAGRELRGTLYSRKAFAKLAFRAAAALRTHGARPGDRTAHYFTDNRLEDICFRLGAALVGAYATLAGAFIRAGGRQKSEGGGAGACGRVEESKEAQQFEGWFEVRGKGRDGWKYS